MDSCLLHICRMGDSIAHNYFYSTVFVVVVSIGLELSQKHVLLFATYHPVACFLFSGCCWLCNCVGDILGWVFLLTMSMPLRPLFSRIMEHAIKLKKNPNNCFLEHDHELTEVKCSQESPDQMWWRYHVGVDQYQIWRQQRTPATTFFMSNKAKHNYTSCALPQIIIHMLYSIISYFRN